MQDPYYRFKDEIEQDIASSEQQTREWDLLRSSPSSIQRADWVKAEIINRLEQSRKQMVDLEKMNAMIMANPSKFNIDQVELDNRRQFVAQSRQRVSAIEAKLNSPPPDTPEMRRAAQVDRMTRSKQDQNQNTIDNELQHQQTMLQRQDENLDMIVYETGTVKTISHQINDELKDQNARMDHINDHMEDSIIKLETTTEKMKKLLTNKETWLWVACAVLTILLLILVIWVFL